MAKRQVSIQDSIETEEEFQAYLENNSDKLICIEVFSAFCGHSVAMGNAVRKGKLEIGGDNIAMAKACSDNIDSLERFKHKSEPTFLFIMRNKLINVLFGANGIELCRLVEEYIGVVKKEQDTGEIVDLPKFEISEMLPVEVEKLEDDLKLDEEYRETAERLRTLALAARKKRVSERLAVNVKRLNFIMFWPQHHQAHYDLYEKWDNLNINVAAKDEFQLTEEDAKEVLYMGDVDLNEAALYHLLDGKVLVVLFKMFDTDDRDFVKLMRYALYEEIPEPKEDTPPEKQLPPIPAFERYSSISKTAREVRRQRYNAKMQKLKEEEEEAARIKKEQERLAREAEEERIKEEKQRKEDERMARLAAGLPASPEPEPEPEPAAQEGEGGEGFTITLEEGAEGAPAAEGEAPTGEGAPAVEGEGPAGEPALAQEPVPPGEPGAEGQPEGVEEPVQEAPPAVPTVFDSDVEVEGEDYIPPGGLFVPGFYSPPNELAKANGLKFFFPKIIATYATLESEILPPHVLVMFTVDKRHEVAEIINQYRDEIFAMGFFVGDDPFHCEHVAYTIKQYDKMIRLRKHLDRMAVMVGRKRSLPLLQLAGLNPIYISSDNESGEKECLTLFPVGYGDDYEDEESVKEEEKPVVIEVKEEVKEEVKPEEVVEEEDEDLED